METFIPILVEHSNNSSGSEIIISSTYPKEDQGILKRIVAEIQKNSKKTGVILLDGDLKEYKEAKDKNESLNSYLVKSETIYVWNDEDARNKTPEEKRSQLGSKAFYYQTNDDLNRRNELKKQKEKQIAEKKRAEEEKKAAEKRPLKKKQPKNSEEHNRSKRMTTTQEELPLHLLKDSPLLLQFQDASRHKDAPLSKTEGKFKVTIMTTMMTMMMTTGMTKNRF